MSDVFDNLPPAPDSNEPEAESTNEASEPTNGPVNDLPSETPEPGPSTGEQASSSTPTTNDEETTSEKPTRDQGFKYPTHVDPMRRLGGVYLDDELRREAEIARAKVEDREPDLENPPAMQSTPLVASHTLERLDPRARDIDDDVTLTVGAGE